MQQSFKKIINGYNSFREKYVITDSTLMQSLAKKGQRPEAMIVACCDSRVDPALILQCDPGEIFVVRNVANIIPPYENDDKHHGTSAALEFGVCYLKVKHLIILGHSNCGGIDALLHQETIQQNDFISHWVSLLNDAYSTTKDIDATAKAALKISYENCLTFPWIKQSIAKQELAIHLWFFKIDKGEIQTYSKDTGKFVALGI